MNRLEGTRLWWGLAPVAAMLALWEAVARLDLAPGRLFFPSFSEVMLELYHQLTAGMLLDHLLSSFLRVTAGLVLGTIAGVAVGALMGWKGFANRALSPIVSLLYPIPALGWLPLLMLWIGVNEALPVAIIFICSFFPICYNTTSGIRSVDLQVVQAARSLGAADLRVLLTVLVPMALPAIFTGLRLEAGMAWRVIIAAEMVAIPTGIGALLMRAESLIRVDLIIVYLMVLSVICFSFERLINYVENRLTSRWR